MGCLKQLRIALRRTQSCDDGSKKKKNRKHWMSPKGKGKEKVFDEPLSSKSKTKGKSDPSPDEKCFHCHKKGHWFKNC
jgi:hypothetical protein